MCISFESQEAANLCAAQQQYLCTDPLVDTTDHVGPILYPNTPLPRFFNVAKQCQYSCNDGTYNVFTVPAGTFVANSQMQADNMAFSYACNTVLSNRLCLENVDETICLGIFASIQVGVAPGMRPPFLYSVSSGSLPPGMSIFNDTPTTAIIEGVPTTPGNYTFGLTVEDDVGQIITKQSFISVLGITNATLPNGEETSAYNAALSAVGGSGSYTFSLVGTLPTGLSMNSAGVISGTPAAGTAGTYSIIVNVSDE